MDAKVECEVLKSCYSRRSGKLSKCRLRKLLSLSPGQEGLKMWRANVVKATLRKYTRCEQKRRLIAKLVNQQQHACSENREMLSGTEAGVVRDALPVCAMAPENTTQYLMDIVYDDMLIDTSSRTTTSYEGLRRNLTKVLRLLKPTNQATQRTPPVSRGRSRSQRRFLWWPDYLCLL
ncbi:hypothetical protein DPEC_G00115390 [Dallia pectoralis]|uniref:Uncharacterized protein n=1 Tax=Dallia pectoralis TaxID=75939 RepID=A0ACC2GUD5_DALPE|nr:hypothetical protein DPEC_G00115390 [Dallia pectoralis]